MNKLSETKAYNSIDNHFGGKFKSLTGLLTNVDMDKYVVPYDLYSDFIGTIKGYRYPLARITYELAKGDEVKNTPGKCIPIMFMDPYKVTDPALDRDVPQNIFTFLRANGTSGLVAYVDTSLMAKYRRETVGEKRPTAYNIKPLHFYAFMQFAAVRRKCQEKDEMISRAPHLLQKLADFYSYLLAKVIDRYYSVAAIEFDYIVLQFLCNCLFLENMAKIPKEKVIQMTLSNRRFSKYADMISSRCNYISSPQFNMCNKHTERDKFPIEEFIDICQDQFKQIEGKMSLRTLNFQYLQNYTQNAMFAIEDFSSFLIMLQSAYLKIGLFNDLSVAKTLGSALSEFLSDLDSVLTK